MLPYYRRWMERFPSVEALAQASEEEVLAYWAGLGYYRRARMLHEAAKQVEGCGWPRTARDWSNLPGVGRYTAAAISSISFGEPAALVDGNVERVFARLTGCGLSGAALQRAAWKWAAANIDRGAPGDWNQGLMELGAIVCTPAEPNCGGCPLKGSCIAEKKGLQGTLPSPVAKPVIVKLRHIVWAPVHNGCFGVRRIGPCQWWAGLWEFPRENQIEDLKILLGECRLEALGDVKHTVTHHRITISVHLARPKERTEALRWLPPDDLHSLPMPSAQRRIAVMAIDWLNVHSNSRVRNRRSVSSISSVKTV